MKNIIIKLLTDELKQNKTEINLEIPPTENLGDYSYPCFSLSKIFKKNPNEISKNLKDKLLKKLPKQISKIENTGPYLNFFINKTLLAQQTIKKITSKNFGKNSSGKKSKFLLEFSQPNTHKAFHVGHIRGTSIGESLARILEFSNYKIIRANYCGDTGMHIAKWIWCYKKYHSKEKLQNSEEWIASIYVEAVKKLSENETLQEEVNEINRSLETKQDKTLNKLWQDTRKLSIKSWDKIYSELGTKFNKWFFESTLEQEAKKISLDLLDKKIAEKSDGAIIMNLKDYNLSVWVLLRQDNTVLYSAKDIALAYKKEKQINPEKYLIIVGDEQNLHCHQLKKTLELMHFKNHQNYNFETFGMIRLPTGKMSSRTGQNILYSSFSNQVKEIAKKRLLERNPKTKNIDKKSLTIAIAAIKYSMLKQEMQKPIIFEPNKSVEFEGDTGPYLLYSYARANSILKKIKSKQKLEIKNLDEFETKLLKKINEFPELIEKTAKQLAPNLMANYAYELAKTFNEFYHNCPVIGSEHQQLRLELVKALKQTLGKSLYLLGIETLEEM